MAEEIKRLKARMKIILISGANDCFRQVDEHLFYMQKPYTRESLSEVISIALAS